MLFTYLFFVTVRIACTVYAGYFWFRMAMLRNSSTSASLYFLFAFVLALAAEVIAIHDSTRIVVYLRSYDHWYVVMKQIIVAMVFVLFLAGTIKMYVITKLR